MTSILREMLDVFKDNKSQMAERRDLKLKNKQLKLENMALKDKLLANEKACKSCNKVKA